MLTKSSAVKMIRREHSLVIVRDVINKKVLLGYKKRGFGKDKWTVLGGKVEPNESIEQGAIREAMEESGLVIGDIKIIGFIEFQFEPKMDETLVCHIFCADSFSGDIRESDEIAPKWFDYDAIPFEKMWTDSQIWLPLLFENKHFKAYFLFKQDLKTLVEYKLEELIK